MRDGGLRDRVREAVADEVIERNFVRATDTSCAHRNEAADERPDWDDLRARAVQVKDHVLTHLDTYVETFTRNAEARGAKVHAAADAGAARAIVLSLLREHGARRILKAKSMTSEEYGLNEAMEAEGFHPLETDLGEYIVQIAGETPSHITAPAMHRSTEQIHELFRREGVLDDAGTPPADRVELARWLSLEARVHLRDRLLAADVGITSANFLAADCGSVVLVENEGNIRYTATSAPVQIAIVGIEKMIPTLEDLGTFLPLLTRSATGQHATSYVQVISGGLEELHIVLLDGGRSRLLADEQDRELLRCIRCGACMNACPVYRTVGGHAYDSPYPGPIGAVLTPVLRGAEQDEILPFFSSLCGACTEVCPVGIDIHGHLLSQRDRSVRKGRRGRLERLAIRLWRFAMSGPRRYRIATGLARFVQRVVPLLAAPRAWSRHRGVPRMARPTFREIWRKHGSAPP